MRTGIKNPDRIPRVVSVSILLLLVCLLTFLGTGTYRFILLRKAENSADRGSLSYIRNQVKNHDTENSVELRENGSMLVLLESDGENVYEMRIYVHDGTLMEEYVPAGREVNPDKAQRLTETDFLNGEWITDHLLKVTTGEGSAFIRLFSGEVLHE